MKRLSEVCKIVGISRRALQGYDEIGLLCPTKKTEGGYWLYDDNAVYPLMTIQVFIEAGYKRKEVKQILNKPKFDFSLECDNVIAMLDAKRKRMDGMIRMMQSFKAIQFLPKKALLAINAEDILRLYKTSSFVDRLKDMVDYLSDDAQPYSEWYHRLGSSIIFLGALKEKPVDDLAVVECSRSIFDLAVEKLMEEARKDGIDERDVPPNEIASFFFEQMDGLQPSTLFEDGVQDENSLQFWEESIPFIIRALKHYCEIVIKEAEQRQHMESGKGAEAQ